MALSLRLGENMISTWLPRIKKKEVVLRIKLIKQHHKPEAAKAKDSSIETLIGIWVNFFQG